jgi:hypothetical protein
VNIAAHGSAPEGRALGEDTGPDSQRCSLMLTPLPPHARGEVRILSTDLFARVSTDRIDDGGFELDRRLGHDVETLPNRFKVVEMSELKC